jgi:hypothetical protein
MGDGRRATSHESREKERETMAVHLRYRPEGIESVDVFEDYADEQMANVIAGGMTYAVSISLTNDGSDPRNAWLTSGHHCDSGAVLPERTLRTKRAAWEAALRLAATDARERAAIVATPITPDDVDLLSSWSRTLSDGYTLGEMDVIVASKRFTLWFNERLVGEVACRRYAALHWTTQSAGGRMWSCPGGTH